jgi:hypothetical protein
VFPELLLALVLLAVLAALGGWYLGLDPDRVMRPVGAALKEAGERTADTAADFRDWLRLGR